MGRLDGAGIRALQDALARAPRASPLRAPTRGRRITTSAPETGTSRRPTLELARDSNPRQPSPLLGALSPELANGGDANLLLTPPFVRTRTRNRRRRSRSEATHAAGRGGISVFAARRAAISWWSPREESNLHLRIRSPAVSCLGLRGDSFRRTGCAHRPIDISFVKEPARERAGGRHGIRTQDAPDGRTGLQPVGGPSAPYRPVAPRNDLVISRQSSPDESGRRSRSQKKGLPGDRPGRPRTS